MGIVTGKIAKKQIKVGDTWTRCLFTITDKDNLTYRLSTFDIKLIDTYQEGSYVKATYESKGGFNNITAMEPYIIPTSEYQPDASVWEQKDLRNAKMNAINNATEIITTTMNLNPEQSKNLSQENILLAILGLADKLLEYIYEGKQWNKESSSS